MNKVFVATRSIKPTLEGTITDSLWWPALSALHQDLLLAHATEMLVPANQLAVSAGSDFGFWPCAIDGLLVQRITLGSGNQTVLTSSSGGTWFGEGTLIKKERWRYDVLALRRSRLALVPRAVFDRLRMESVPFNHALQEIMNARLGHFIATIVNERMLTPKGRVARTLAALFAPELYRRKGPFIDMRQSELALLVGLSRQRTNEALGELEREGLLELRRGGILVQHLDQLFVYEDGAPGKA